MLREIPTFSLGFWLESDFGTVGSFQTLQLLRHKIHLGSFSSREFWAFPTFPETPKQNFLGIFFPLGGLVGLVFFCFGFFFPSFSVVVLRDIIPKFIGIPEADAGREGWEPFPIPTGNSGRSQSFPLWFEFFQASQACSCIHLGWSFPLFFWEFQRFNPKSIRGPVWFHFWFLILFFLGLLPEFQTNPRGRIPGLIPVRRILWEIWGIFLGKL